MAIHMGKETVESRKAPVSGQSVVSSSESETAIEYKSRDSSKYAPISKKPKVVWPQNSRVRTALDFNTHRLDEISLLHDGQVAKHVAK